MSPFTGDFESVRLDTLAFMLLDNAIYYACGQGHVNAAIAALSIPSITWDSAKEHIARVRAYRYNARHLVHDNVVERLALYSSDEIADMRVDATVRGSYSTACKTRIQRSAYAPIPLADVRASVISSRVVPDPDEAVVAGSVVGISADTMAEISGGRRRTERLAFGYGQDKLRTALVTATKPFVMRSGSRVLHVAGTSTPEGDTLIEDFISETSGTWSVTREYAEMPDDTSSGPALVPTLSDTIMAATPAHAPGDVHMASGAVVHSIVGTAIKLDRPIFADGEAVFRNSAKGAWDVFEQVTSSQDVPTLLAALKRLHLRNRPPQNNSAVWWHQAQRAHAKLGQRYALDLVLQGKFADYVAYQPSAADQSTAARTLGRYAT